jgi:D-3-phosphoglycerate dehydrogenase
MKRVLCIEARPFAVSSPVQMDRVKARPDVEVLDCRGKTVQDPAFVDQLSRAEVLVSGNNLQITGDLLSRLGKLKLVAKLGVGLDMIDIPAATRQKVMICNTPGANAVAVAEHTFALLLGLLRQVPRGDAGMRAGRWEQGKFLGREIQGRTFGIVGLGAIGSCVARIAKGFGCRILGHNPSWPESFAEEHSIERADLHTLLCQADFVCIHCPLLPETANLISGPQLALMKPSAILVNMARGGIVDERALYAALKSGRISGAVLDAFSQEPPVEKLPFAELDNVMLSPHTGAFTEAALDNMGRLAIDQVFQYLDGQRPAHLCNPGALE